MAGLEPAISLADGKFFEPVERSAGCPDQAGMTIQKSTYVAR
jgi:hypothetical protein